MPDRNELWRGCIVAACALPTFFLGWTYLAGIFGGVAWAWVLWTAPSRPGGDGDET